MELLPITVDPKTKNVWRHPDSNKTGNNIFPKTAPILEEAMTTASISVLKEKCELLLLILKKSRTYLNVVGKRSTVKDWIRDVQILYSVTAMEARDNVASELVEKYIHDIRMPQQVDRVTAKEINQTFE